MQLLEGRYFHDKLVSCLWVLFAQYITAIDASLQEVERHLEMGKQFLAKGQFSDALTHYHAAVDLDPDNYQTLYRRATVYLATGKSKSAIPDLDKVIKLKPDFSAARLQRGNVLLKQGNLDSAFADFKAVSNSSPEAAEKMAQIPQVKEFIEYANELYENKDFLSAADYYTQALEVCPWYPELHANRANCYENVGELPKAIADIRATTKLVPDSTDAYFRVSKLLYRIGDTEESLNQIRECLKLEPDHKSCFPHYKHVKKLFKQQQQMREYAAEEKWMDCLERGEKILKTEPKVISIRLETEKLICKCENKAGHSVEAISICSLVLDNGGHDVDTLCNRAESYINQDLFDDAVRDYQEALDIEQESRRAKEGLNRAHKLLKQSKKRDYYKILGIRRNANKREITKAYRLKAQKWHPDNFQEGTEKKAAEAKFIDIAAAKEVLTDPKMRERFDNGEDPMDPEQQQNSQQHPFHGFGGGGGGHSFKFHFQ